MVGSDRPNTENKDGTDARPDVLELEDGTTVLHDSENHQAWM